MTSRMIVGQVISGRGNAASHLRNSAAELKKIAGADLVEGSLNILLKRPLKLANGRAAKFDHGHRLLWKAYLNGKPVWLYRWQHAPLHVIEVLSPINFRKTYGLHDGDKVIIQPEMLAVEAIPRFSILVWSLLWMGRRAWCYTHDRYYFHTMGWGRRFGATQEDMDQRMGGQAMEKIKSLVKKLPVIGPIVLALKHLIAPSRPDLYRFERIEAGDDGDPLRQLQNVLNYTKTSGSSYAARQYPAGYHSIEIDGHRLKGQRDPARRLELVPFDFNGKTVLDIGTNQGGMLFQIAGKVKWAVGVDYDPRMVNAANRIRSATGAGNLSFYVLDLEREPLALIQDLMPEPRVDIVFLLAVCMWLANWREVIDFAAGISGSMLFEANGADRQQADQEQYLRSLYGKALILAESSEDDPGQKKRRLLYFSEPLHRA